MNNPQAGKLPHDEQLEAAALGALMLWGRVKGSQPGYPDRVAPFFAACSPTDFYVPANAALAAAIKASAAEFDAVDNHLVWQKINDLGFVGAFAALDGSAYTSLGTLYYKVPGFPIGFGDHKKARQLLEAALKVNPDGIDSNYFYGEYLFDEDR